MKVVTVVGARPQFIKAASVSKILRERRHFERLIHTGQHYDQNLSEIFFEQLEMPQPAYNLGIGSASHAKQTGEMMVRIEEVLSIEKPDWVLVFGDTNSTLAAALAAGKLQTPIAHVEAGERNFNRDFTMVHPTTIPEELNRVLTDHVSTLLLCVSEQAIANLERENIHKGVHLVGDVSYDIFLKMTELANGRPSILERLGVHPKQYALTTIHHAVNTEQRHRMNAIVSALSDLALDVIFPMHPRTRKTLVHFGLWEQLHHASNVHVTEPVGYLEMLELERNARVIMTDSGGVIREAYFSDVPCVIMDETTEWVELVRSGWSQWVDANPEAIHRAVNTAVRPTQSRPSFGNGNASVHIVRCLENGR